MVLNQILTLWQLQQALPWSHIEDPYLRAAFYYANPSAKLYKQKWSANEAKQVYVALQTSMFKAMEVSQVFYVFYLFLG